MTLAQENGDARTLASVYLIKELTRLGLTQSVPEEVIEKLAMLEYSNVCRAFDDGRQWNNSWDSFNYFLELYQHNFNNNEFRPDFDNE